MNKALTVINAIIILAIAAGIAYALSGGYNIAAAEKHWDITFKAIETVRNRSIAAHSEDLEKPLPTDVDGFITHFHDSCRTCHGAPGVSPAEFVEGLYPKPPTLHKTETQKRWSDGEIVWIIANGIKMTAMPAFGPSHGVSEIHGLAGFARKLPNMDDAAYRQLATSHGLPMETGGHRHGEGGHHGASSESQAETPPEGFLDELETTESGSGEAGDETGHGHEGSDDGHAH
jgi:hypothetical protein